MRNFNGFVGQKKIINHLKSQLQGAQALGQACPHVLLMGASGMGKTKLAKALAQEAGTELRVVHGKATPDHICMELLQMAKGDFLLLDEAHTLSRDAQEALYEVIDTHCMTDRLKIGSSKQQANQANATPAPVKNSKGKLMIPEITFVLATDQPSGVLEALHRRMDIAIHIHNYQKQELMEIASIAASEANLLLSTEALQWIARTSQGQPRRTIKAVEGMQRLFHSDHKRELTKADVVKYLKSTGKDSRGLDQEQQLYMERLYRMGRASLSTLTSLLGTEEEYTEDKIESGLIRLGMINRGVGGRTLTGMGNKWAQKRAKAPQTPNQGQTPTPAVIHASNAPTATKVLSVLDKQIPKTMKQVVVEAQLNDTCYGLMNKLVDKGVVKKQGNGYLLA